MLSRCFVSSLNKRMLAPHALDIADNYLITHLKTLIFKNFIFVKFSYALVRITNKSLRPKEESDCAHLLDSHFASILHSAK